MQLFKTESTKNILPIDGEVFYYGQILDHKVSYQLLNALLDTLEWQNDQSFIYGKLITTKRKVAWHGNEAFEYTYSKISRKAKPWTNELLFLKSLIENTCGETFNSCLVNLYHSGEEGMSWHSDAEKELKRNSAIASFSLGAERKFMFRHKETKESIAIQLENASLLVMKGATQHHWKHQLPISKRIKSPRINLTFRTIER